MAKFAENPQSVESYFDMSLLRTSAEDEVTVGGNIMMGQVVNVNALIGDLELAPDTILRIRNKSTSANNIVFYSAVNPTDVPGMGPQFALAAGASQDVPLSSFNLSSLQEYINVYNSGPAPGEWEIEVVE
jgi:hypothetical protein